MCRRPDLPQESGSETLNVNPPDVTGDLGCPPVERPLSWGCSFCERTFSTKTGLGVHKRRAHPVETNLETAPNLVKRRWTDEELQLMASTEAQLVSERGRCTNVDLLSRLPQLERTLEAIKGQRRSTRYRSMVQSCLATVSQASPDPAMITGAGGSLPTPQRAARPSVVPEELSDSPATIAYEPAAVPDVPCAGPDETLQELLRRAEGRGSHGKARRAARRPLQNGAGIDGALSAKKSKKSLRRAEYGRVQELFKKSRSRAATEIIDGHCRVVKHSPGELEAYWRPIFEAVSGAPGPRPETLEAARRKGVYGGADGIKHLWDPITLDEVKGSRVDRGSAPGPDGIRAEEWITVPNSRKTEMFNLWMRKGEIPEPLRQCRTVFVPKVDAPAGPGDYRPISIASVPLRHMHSILARRLLACCPPDPRQRGFIHADGTLENSAVLDAVMGDCRKRLKECHVAVLDFSKAFDTVSHEALLRLLGAKGLPKEFCAYIARLYSTATTTLAVNGNSGLPINVGKGVRQGDPLSPLLFNVVMDSILGSVPSYVGYRLEGELISALAYADDVVLISGSKVGMQESLNRVAECGAQLGLRINKGKSSVLSMVPDCHRKRLHYLTEKSFTVGRGQKLRQVTCVERWRYLGVDFQATGCVALEHDVATALTNITKAPLKPQQRLELLRGHLVPRFLHGLVLGRISEDRLRMLDVQIRSAVRKWLRLPADIPKAYFHARVKDGGLGVPSLQVLVPDLIVTRYGALECSEWGAARAAARSERIRKKLSWAKNRLRKFTNTTSSCEDRNPPHKVWRESLYASTDGFELRESGHTAASTKWLRERSWRYSGRDFVQFVHTHINALPSRVRTTRGRRNGDDSQLNCRAGCGVRETGAHTIQQCHRTHGGRIERHNLVVRVLSEELTRLGWRVEGEPRIHTALGLRKPDIIAVKEGKGVILDAQIVSGQRPLDDAHRAKRRKYGGHTELVELVADKLGVPNGCVGCTSCTISWRGVWSRASLNEMKDLLSFPASLFDSIPELVLRGSHMNWTRFNSMTTMRGQL